MLAKTELKPIGPWLAPQPPPQLVDFHQPRKWRALITRRPMAAADFLKAAGQWVYWPNYAVRVGAGGHRQGGRRSVFRSLLPGYLFLAVHPLAGDPWDLVHVTPGVTGFLRGKDGQAAALTDQDIEIVRQIEAGMNLPVDPKTAHRFRPGDRVRFLDDLYGRWPPGGVLRLAEDGRIVVEVALLGQVVPITVLPHQIEGCR